MRLPCVWSSERNRSDILWGLCVCVGSGGQANLTQSEHHSSDGSLGPLDFSSTRWSFLRLHLTSCSESSFAIPYVDGQINVKTKTGIPGAKSVISDGKGRTHSQRNGNCLVCTLVKKAASVAIWSYLWEQMQIAVGWEVGSHHIHHCPAGSPERLPSVREALFWGSQRETCKWKSWQPDLSQLNIHKLYTRQLVMLFYAVVQCPPGDLETGILMCFSPTPYIFCRDSKFGSHNKVNQSFRLLGKVFSSTCDTHMSSSVTHWMDKSEATFGHKCCSWAKTSYTLLKMLHKAWLLCFVEMNCDCVKSFALVFPLGGYFMLPFPGSSCRVCHRDNAISTTTRCGIHIFLASTEVLFLSGIISKGCQFFTQSGRINDRESVNFRWNQGGESVAVNGRLRVVISEFSMQPGGMVLSPPGATSRPLHTFPWRHGTGGRQKSRRFTCDRWSPHWLFPLFNCEKLKPKWSVFPVGAEA